MPKHEIETKYLIIGNSAGGIGAAEAIREVDKAGSITMVSDEGYPSYSRPLISEYLTERCPLERMLYRPANFYEENEINALLGYKVRHLSLPEHTTELENGERISWEKLLLATGGTPIVPPIEGIDKRGVFTFISLDDAKAIDLFLNKAARAVVIGGGLIGVSVAEALVKREIEVTIVEMKEHLLNLMLDEETSALEEKILRASGVEIVTGHTVTKIYSDSPEAETIGSVTLDDGTIIPCELVIAAIGVRPRTELISNTTIKINRGVIVDHHMTTSSPDVYACGDVAEAYDFIYGENRVIPIWPNAYSGGRVAGFNMAGTPTEYRGGTSMNSMRYFDLAVASAGIVIPPDDSYEVIRGESEGSCRKVILKDGLIEGMVFAGDVEKSGIIFNLMKDRVNVDSFKRTLVAEDFGLASLPQEIWRPKLENPPSLSASQGACPEPAEEACTE